MVVSHTIAQVKNTSPDWLFICCQLSGHTIISQNGNEASLVPGTLTLVEPLLPYDARFLGRSKMLCLKVPRSELRARLGRNRELVARLVTADRLDDGLTLSLVASLPSLIGKITPATEAVVETHALDLIGLSIARTIEGASHRVSIPRSIKLSSIRSVIDTRLADRSLDAEAVADAVGISVRYVNRLFADTGSSLKRFILSRRLARCRHAFEDPNQAHRTVREIAQGWGFSDMTHFARRFKEAYGVSPSEYQKMAAQSSEV
jgi:AraC-like DNA-binding protein